MLDGDVIEMAKILPFAKSKAGRKQAAPRSAGEIVIFPGVRIEYHDRPPETEPKHRQRARRNSSEDVLSA
jgi:hypothetical protein